MKTDAKGAASIPVVWSSERNPESPDFVPLPVVFLYVTGGLESTGRMFRAVSLHVTGNVYAEKIESQSRVYILYYLGHAPERHCFLLGLTLAIDYLL